jgi:hypothetical protein
MKKIVLSIALFLFTNAVFAQTTFGDNVTDAPLDGGLSLLLSSGLVYGIYKKRKNK